MRASIIVRLALPSVLAAIAVIAAPAAAFAGGDEAAADAAIRRGIDLRKLGRDQDALEEFRKAYAVAKTPRALAQIGLAEQALGRWVDAEADLDQAMANKTDPWIRKNGATLSGALDVIHRHLGSLEVIGPEGAELRVDGRAVGTLPLAKPARVPIGNPTVELRKPGFFPVTRPVSIAVGELTRESMDLQAVAVATPSPPSASPPARSRDPALSPIRAPAGESDGTVDHQGTRLDAPTDTMRATRSWQRPLAWTVAAGALLGGAVGGAALWIRSGEVKNAGDLNCNVDEGSGTVNPLDPANQGRCRELANNASRAKLAAIVSFSAAGALAVSAVVLFATAPSSTVTVSRDHSTARAGLTCAPTLATAGVACQLRF